MAGRSGSGGDQYARNYPRGGPAGGTPGGRPAGYGYPPGAPGPSLFGPPQAQQPRQPQQSAQYQQAQYQQAHQRGGRQVPRDPRAPFPSTRPGGRSPAPGRRRLIDYPRAGKVGFWRWVPSWKLLLTVALGVTVTVFVGLLAAYAATPIPPIQADTTAQTTRVLYDDGSPITTFSVQNRTIVGFDKMSNNIKVATIAAEDRTFYANKGISPIGIVRAAYNNARGRDVQGGSTITQQYVKNTRIDSARTWRRKIKEFFIAIKINNELTKDEILANYLNTIYFGRNTYGIEAASQSYFQVHAAQLTFPQAAYLAGIINGPELYDVLTSDGKPDAGATELSRARYKHVLDGMVEMDKISQEQADAYVASFDTDVVKKVKPVRKKVSREDDQTIYLEQMVRAELTGICKKDLDGCKSFADIARGGYTIRTTFNRKLIAQAVAAVHDKDIGMGPRSKWPSGTQVGLVSIDPSTGAVKAIYGGDGDRYQNAATQDRPLAGSIYKPFTLLAALEGPSHDGSDGIGLKSRFSGRSPMRYDAKYVNPSESNKVTNFGGEQFGMIDLITATEHSVNTVFAQLNQEIGGGERTQDAAIRAGLTKNEIGTQISNTLGSDNPTVVDMASAYGTIAAQGTHHPYYVIQSVQSSSGAVPYRHDDSGASKAFSKDVTADATYAMQKVITGGTGNYAQRLGRPVAGKTGTVGGTGRTTQAAWFVGFTPQLSTAVAIHRVGSKGEPDVVKGWGVYAGRDMQGGMFPVRVWTSYMQRALDGQPREDFPEPAWVGETLNPAPEPVVTPTPTDGQPFPGQDPGTGPGLPGPGLPSVTDQPWPVDQPGPTDLPGGMGQPSEATP